MKTSPKAMELPIARLKKHALLVGIVIALLAAALGYIPYGEDGRWPSYALCIIIGVIAGYLTLWLMEITVIKVANGAGKHTAILWMLLRVLIFAVIFFLAIKFVSITAGLGIALGYLAVLLGLFISNAIFPKIAHPQEAGAYVVSQKNKEQTANKCFIVIKSYSMSKDLHGRRYVTYRRFRYYDKAAKEEETPEE